MPQDQYKSDPARRQAGIKKMTEVYGWEMGDGLGDFFGMTVEHLFGDVWGRDTTLTLRERRLLLIGLMVGDNLPDVLGIQLEATLTQEELTPDELREVALFLSHYAGWPRGARMNSQVEEIVARAEKKKAAGAGGDG
jgi:4-carboxymuconolactone decarboxylase